MKTIYLVRHGQTDGNSNGLYQHWDTPLSAHGQEQASVVAERFTRIPFDAIVASDMARATSTGEAIAKATGHTLELEPLFREIIRPTAIRGKYISDPEAMAIRRFTDENFTTGKRHSDEENFFDLRSRAVAAVAFLEKKPEKTIVAVSHGTFIKMIISVMAFGEELSDREFARLDHLLYPSNTGITKCINKNGRWQMHVWNDDAHLG
jgi:broad specificity phosphatase PhoE